MHIIKCISLFIFVVLANEITARNIHFPDPRRNARESCRRKMRLTERELIDAKQDFLKIKNYLVCLGKSSGQVNEDDTINREVFIENLSSAVPVTILGRIVDVCINKVYGHKLSARAGSPTKVAKYDSCFRDLLPESLYETLGILTPAIYRPLEQYPRW